MRTGLVWRDDFGRYESGMQGPLEEPHPLFEPYPTIDSPVPKRRLKTLLDASGLTAKLSGLTARPASIDELRRCHTL
jgi:hypothetical protein